MDLWDTYGIFNWKVLLITTIVLLYLYVDRKFQYWKRCGVESQSMWDCLKMMHALLTKPLQDVILQIYKKHSRTYGIYIGFQPQLVISDPSLLKLILVKDFQAFHNRPKMEIGEPTFDNMLTLLQDDKWKRVRCVMGPTFTSSRMRKMAYLVKECAEKFSKYCEKTAEINKEVDCKMFYIGFTIDIIASTAFGTKINALDDPNHPFVQNAKKLSNQDSSLSLILLFAAPKLIRFISEDVFGGGSFKYFRRFAMHVIEEREKNNIHANDFLQLMIDAQRGTLDETEDDSKDENEKQYVQSLPDHKRMTLDEALSQCITFLVTGAETNSTTLAFLTYYMALHPEYQERLIKEIDDTWENHTEDAHSLRTIKMVPSGAKLTVSAVKEDINFDVLNKMTYLDAIICEVLRIQPFALQLTRQATEDYVLGDTGIKLEKDTQIMVPIYAMHRDPEFFTDPEKFDPDRFMPENRQNIPPYVYMPFGEGPRNCIAMRFATMVLKMCVAYLFRTVRVEATENTKKPLEFNKGLGVLLPKRVMVRLNKRKDVNK